MPFGGPGSDSLWEAVWKGGGIVVNARLHHYSQGRDFEPECEFLRRMKTLARASVSLDGTLGSVSEYWSSASLFCFSLKIN